MNVGILEITQEFGASNDLFQQVTSAQMLLMYLIQPDQKMKILAFAASSSKTSINKQLAFFAAQLLKNADVELLDLNDFELPLYSIDRESELGQPALSTQFLNKIAQADALVVSFAEHNGSYTAAYKNLFDWCSRQTKNVWQGKPMVFLSTSPGQRGGLSVLKTAVESAPFFGGMVKASIAIPLFYENFDIESRKFKNQELLLQLMKVVNKLSS